MSQVGVNGASESSSPVSFIHIFTTPRVHESFCTWIRKKCSTNDSRMHVHVHAIISLVGNKWPI